MRVYNLVDYICRYEIVLLKKRIHRKSLYGNLVTFPSLHPCLDMSTLWLSTSENVSVHFLSSCTKQYLESKLSGVLQDCGQFFCQTFWALEALLFKQLKSVLKLFLLKQYHGFKASTLHTYRWTMLVFVYICFSCAINNPIFVFNFAFHTAFS